MLWKWHCCYGKYINVISMIVRCGIMVNYINEVHTYKSQDHDHQCADLVITWLPKEKREREHRLWDLCEALIVYILLSTFLISQNGIDHILTWYEKINCMNSSRWFACLKSFINIVHEELMKVVISFTYWDTVKDYSLSAWRFARCNSEGGGV